jgi:hypothetical protein
MESVEELLSMARAETGLDDFGDDSFREGLGCFVGSLQTEARLTSEGESRLRRLILTMLSQRLQVEDWYRRHPEIDDERIEAPVINVGLPRAGSTALLCLLAEDPNVRWLSKWEAAEPCPPPSTVRGPDPRLERARAMIAERSSWRKALTPGNATGPQECQWVMAMDFKALMFQAFAGHIPSYTKWMLYDADFTSTYEYEKRVLKLLQWGTPARPWRLKCPNHLPFLEQLNRVFPDARFVMTHRDALEVVVSFASLMVEISRPYTDDVDPRYLGALNVELWSVGLERALAFRDDGNEDRFYDMDFRAMQKDPIGEVRGLYEWLGEPFTDEFEAAMRRWWKENSENRVPNRHPGPSSFGIDVEAVRPLFADYTARAAGWTARPNPGGL